MTVATSANPLPTTPGLRFLGVGTARAERLGSSAAVLEWRGRPRLLIDCGPDVPDRFHACYGDSPPALFITHVHLDHVAGLEQLYARLALDGNKPPLRLFVPVDIIPALHRRVADLRFSLAEGGGNFWDVFQLIPVEAGFWHENFWFDVFEVRHHAPRFAWGLRLQGRFLYSGDTRPVPEVLRYYGAAGERLFHDCCWRGNPSHTGWDDMLREYDADLRARMVVYHYASVEAGRKLWAAGATVATPGARFDLDEGELWGKAQGTGPGRNEALKIAG